MAARPAREWCNAAPGAAAVLLFAMLVAPTPASAQYAPQSCRDMLPDTMSDAAFLAALPNYQRCLRDFLGIVPIETRASSGDEVVRAWIDRGERNTAMFIEYRKAKSGTAALQVKVLAEDKPSLSMTVAPDAFAAVQSRWNGRAAYEAEAKGTQDLFGESAGIRTVCVPSWGAQVETASGGAVTSTELDSCKSWEFAFAHDIIARALKDSGCAALVRDGSDDMRLRACVGAKRS